MKIATCISVMRSQPKEKIVNGETRRQESCHTRHRFINSRGRPIISTAALCQLPVHNHEGRALGVLKDLMIETDRGTATYAILLFEDNKSFALPFSALEIDLESKIIYVDIQYEVFAEATGMQVPPDIGA